MDAQKLQQEKPRATWKTIGAVIGGIAAIIGIITGVIAIVHSLQNHIDSFEGEVAQQATADNFVSFANNHDGKVVWLNITCLSSLPGSVCCAATRENCDAPPEMDGYLIISVHGTSAKYWFHINTAGTDAQANNGSYGAGALVLKGYFEVSVQGVLGGEPQDVQNTFLKGVDSSAVNKG